MGNGTSLGRVRGLGSAKEGAHHWIHQRMTAGSNILLMTWFMISIARLPAYDYATVRTWLSSAWVALPMALLILSVFTHFRMGLQTVIEDYQSDESRIAMLVLRNAWAYGLGAIAIFSILKVAFTGAPA
jgi:succinate dehydrogenase / fumarate reductase membrane anchor subunit